MNPGPSQNWPLTPAQLAALQSALAGYESGWASGASPSIEPHLVDDPAVRPALLAELVLSEARHRAAAGDVARLDDYLDRFPELAHHPDVLRSVQPALKSIASAARPTAAGTSQGSPSDTKFATDFDEAKGPLTFGRYRLEKKLGEGGMGAVFLASDSVLGRKVAIKIPFLTSKKERQELLARFHREARCAAALDHPNVCGVFDVGEIDGQPYIAMAYVSGKPLSDFIRAKAEIPVKTALQLAQKLAKTLEHAHSRGVLHRDLKPSNILINDRKEPVVMDFGLARLESARDADPLTRSGDIVGTPAYMPPEQLAGKQKEMGPWSDVYSLGMVLYQVLTKQRPFNGDLFEIVHKIANETVAPPSTLRPEIEPAVDALVLKALEKDAGQRFRSMGEFAAAIAVCLKATPESSGSLGSSSAGAGLPPTGSAAVPKPNSAGAAANAIAAAVAPRPASDEPQTATLKASDPTPSVQPSVVPSARRPTPETAVSIASEAPGAARPSTTAAMSAPAASRASAPVAKASRTAAPASKGSAGKAAPKTAGVGRRPPRKFPPLAWAGASGAVLLLGVVFFLPAGKGTLRVELKDPSVEVKIKGTELVFTGADPQEVRLTPGEKTLIVQRGDFQFETKSLTLKKNDTVTAVVEFLEGEVRVAANGVEVGRGGQTMPRPTGTNIEDKPAVPTVSKWQRIVWTDTLLKPWRDGIRNDEQATIVEGSLLLRGRNDHVLSLPDTSGRNVAVRARLRVISGKATLSARRNADGRVAAYVHGPGYKKEEVGIGVGQNLAWTDLSIAPAPRALGQSFDWMLICQDDQLEVHVDNTPVIKTRDSRHLTSGLIGIAAAGEVLFESLEYAILDETPASSASDQQGFALEFDGVDDYVLVPGLTLPEGPHTLEAWIHADLDDLQAPRTIAAGARAGEISTLYCQDRMVGSYHLRGDRDGYQLRLVNETQAKAPLHLAMTNDGRTTSVYVQGRRSADFKDARTANDIHRFAFSIGAIARLQEGSGEPPITATFFRGRISAVRLSEGVRYSADFEPKARLKSDKETLALYSFEEGQGEELKDSSGHGHHGKIFGAKWVSRKSPEVSAPPPRKFALEFNGAGDSVDLGAWKLPEGPATLEAWVTPLNAEPAHILWLSSPQWFTLETSMGRLMVSSVGADGIGHIQPVDTRFEVGRRIHLAGAWDGKKVSLFVNGQPSGVETAGPVGWSWRGERQQVYLARQIAETTKWWKGRLDAVRISRSVRYTQRFVPAENLEKEPTTLALYDFSEGQGTELKDSSGNNHHGKVHGAKWVWTDGTPIVSTKPWTPTPEFKAWMDGVAKMTPIEQVKAVSEKMKEVNPGFDGELRPSFDADGRVFSVNFSKNVNLTNDAVVDISPLVALKDLKDLGIEGDARGGSKIRSLSPLTGLKLTHLNCCFTQVSDLSPLSGMPLKLLNSPNVSDYSPIGACPLEKLRGNFIPARDAALLRSIKTLKTINDKPAAEFLKELEAGSTNPTTSVPKPPVAPAPPVFPNDPERTAAAWALSRGGAVRVLHQSGDKHLSRLDELPTEGPLRVLAITVSNSKVVTDAELQLLATLKAITWLELNGDANVTDAGLEHLAGLTTLQRLGLKGASLRGPGLRHLAGLSKLQYLALANAPLEDASFQTLGPFPELTVLDVWGTRIGAGGLERVASVAKVAALNLGSCRIGAAEMRVISRMPLTDLLMEHSETSDEALRELKAPELAQLLLGYAKITDAGLRDFSRFPKLAELNLSGTGVGDEGMRSLEALSNLRFLGVADTNVTDRGLATIARIRGLEHLNLISLKLTATGLTELKALPLRIANLGGVTLDRDAARAIGTWSGLETLVLSTTSLTDDGLAELTKLSKLRYLDVQGTKVTAAGVANLKNALPQCQVTWDGSK